MAKRRFVIHIGLPHAGGGSLAGALADHAAPLAEAGVRVPARSTDEARRAALELRRLHSTYGFKRKEVEGICTPIMTAMYSQGGGGEGHQAAGTVSVDDPALKRIG